MSVGEKYQVMFIVPKKVQIQKSRSQVYDFLEFAMKEVGFPICNDGNRVRKFAMPARRNRLQ